MTRSPEEPPQWLASLHSARKAAVDHVLLFGKHELPERRDLEKHVNPDLLAKMSDEDVLLLAFALSYKAYEPIYRAYARFRQLRTELEGALSGLTTQRPDLPPAKTVADLYILHWALSVAEWPADMPEPPTSEDHLVIEAGDVLGKGDKLNRVTGLAKARERYRKAKTRKDSFFQFSPKSRGQ